MIFPNSKNFVNQKMSNRCFLFLQLKQLNCIILLLSFNNIQTNTCYKNSRCYLRFLRMMNATNHISISPVEVATATAATHTTTTL